MLAVRLLIISPLVCSVPVGADQTKNDENPPKEILDKSLNEDDSALHQMDETRPSHILMFHPWNTKSHRIQQSALLEGLLAKGHRVTGVFPQSSSIRHDRYTEIVVEDG